jgi:hypothetical protein
MIAEGRMVSNDSANACGDMIDWLNAVNDVLGFGFLGPRGQDTQGETRTRQAVLASVTDSICDFRAPFGPGILTPTVFALWSVQTTPPTYPVIYGVLGNVLALTKKLQANTSLVPATGTAPEIFHTHFVGVLAKATLPDSPVKDEARSVALATSWAVGMRFLLSSAWEHFRLHPAPKEFPSQDLRWLGRLVSRINV